MEEIDKLVRGFARFRQRYFQQEPALFDHLRREGQSPKILIIACCDSRVDPALITDANPGDLFVVRNVANLVPPYETGGHRHGTSAALEFAVRCLHVRHVIVLGHAHCGGIRALMQGMQASDQGEFIVPWMSVAQCARDRVLAEMPHADADAQARAVEQAAVRTSLDNLVTFPWIQARVDSGKLDLHGWYFDIDSGQLLRYDEAAGTFDTLSVPTDI